jgi:hypothetical protein
MLAAVLALAAIVSIATAREIRIGARAMAESDAAMARHDATAALASARDAAEAYAPASPYVRAGFARIEAIARDAETRNDERAAVAAWSAMGAAATATSGPFVATASWRALADDGVTRASARGATASSETHAPESVIRASLARDEGPSTFALMLLGAGALAFFAGAFRLAFAAGDLASLRQERVAVIAASAGLALYILACLRA